MPTFDRLRHFDRAAVLNTVRTACQVHAPDLTRPTPCAGWNVAALLTHLSRQHRGFAAAARGEGQDPRRWQPDPPADGRVPDDLPDDPVADYLAAAAEVVTAFGQPGLEQAELWLPSINPRAPFPASLAVSFHLVDYVVHGWDLARALGRGYPDDLVAGGLVTGDLVTGNLVTAGFRSDGLVTDDLLAAVWDVTRQVPDGPERDKPGAAFAPGHAVEPDAPLIDRILGALGRSPGWRPS